MNIEEANNLLISSLQDHQVLEVGRAFLGGADANHTCPDGGRPLHLAASYKDSEDVLKIVGLLLSHGAEVDPRDSKGFTPLMVAAQNGNGKMVSLLLDKKAQVDLTLPETGETVLHLAMKQNSLDTARELLDAGSDIGAKTSSDGSTALHLAAKFGHGQSAEAILKHHSFKVRHLDIKNKAGETPSQVASLHRHHDLAQRIDLAALPH